MTLFEKGQLLAKTARLFACCGTVLCLTAPVAPMSAGAKDTGPDTQADRHQTLQIFTLPLLTGNDKGNQGYGPGDGDGTGYGPGDCTTAPNSTSGIFLAKGGNGGGHGGDNGGGHGPGDGSGNGGDGPADGTGNGPGAGTGDCVYSS